MKPNQDQTSSIFTSLLELPLLKGIGHAKIQEMVGHTRFHFLKYQPGDVLLSSGDSCTHIKFLLSGTVVTDTVSPDGRLSIRQELTAPQVIAPDHLFGRVPAYPCTATALTEVGLVQITKEDYMRLLAQEPVFMFNLLNFISTDAQKASQGLLALTQSTPEQRIAYWIITLTQPGSNEITLSCTHRDLATIIGISRQAFQNAVERLEAQGVARSTSPRTLHVMNRQALIDLLF